MSQGHSEKAHAATGQTDGGNLVYFIIQEIKETVSLRISMLLPEIRSIMTRPE